MSKTPDRDTPDFLVLPPEFGGATTQELADQFIHLSETKDIGGNTRRAASIQL